jgi:hypothetical protein
MKPNGWRLLAATILMGAVSGSAAAQAPADAPLLFVENVGQFDARARFQVRGASEVLWLADDAIWLARVGEDRAAQEAWSLRLSFPGASPIPPCIHWSTARPMSRTSSATIQPVGILTCPSGRAFATPTSTRASISS